MLNSLFVSNAINANEMLNDFCDFACQKFGLSNVHQSKVAKSMNNKCSKLLFSVTLS